MKDMIQNLRTSIAEKRTCGTVIVEIRNRSVDGIQQNLLDHFVSEIGLTSLGNDWLELSEAEAHRHLAAVLMRDLAYSTVVMDKEEADALAYRFMSIFVDNRRYFSNTDVDNILDETNAPGAWTPLTNATFDTGVVIYTEKIIGILWVADED